MYELFLIATEMNRTSAIKLTGAQTYAFTIHGTFRDCVLNILQIAIHDQYDRSVYSV